jgi:hypothetical protein
MDDPSEKMRMILNLEKDKDVIKREAWKDSLREAVQFNVRYTPARDGTRFSPDIACNKDDNHLLEPWRVWVVDLRQWVNVAAWIRRWMVAGKRRRRLREM